MNPQPQEFRKGTELFLPVTRRAKGGGCADFFFCKMSEHKFDVEEWTHAAKEGNWEAMEPMTRTRGFHIDAVDTRGNTALMYACLRPGTDIRNIVIRELLERGAKTEIYDRVGNTALHTAARYGNFRAILVLLDYGANIYACNIYEQSILHQVCKGHSKQITIYDNAAHRIKIITFLLEKGLDANARDIYDWTPLHYIACLRNTECSLAIIRLLIDNGADINALDKRKLTPLRIAVHKHWKYGEGLRTVKYLLHQDDVVYDAPLEYHNTTLLGYCASLRCNDSEQEGRILELVKVLLDHGANIDSCATIFIYDSNAKCRAFFFEERLRKRALFCEERFRRRLAHWQRQFKQQKGISPDVTSLIFLRSWLEQPVLPEEIRAIASILCIPQELQSGDVNDLRVRISMQLSLGEFWNPNNSRKKKRNKTSPNSSRKKKRNKTSSK